MPRVGHERCERPGRPPIGAGPGEPVLRRCPHRVGGDSRTDAPAELSGRTMSCTPPSIDVFDVSERGVHGPRSAEVLDDFVRETFDANGFDGDYAHRGVSVGCSVR